MSRHYTYALIDPRDLTCPFYIGKGVAERRFSHFKSSFPLDKRKNPQKMKRIDEIEGAGLKPQAVVLEWYDSAEEAYEGEKAYIAKYGLDNLTNKNVGGAGGKAKPSTKAKVVTLTVKEEQFCQNIASGKFDNNTDAFRAAYQPKTKNKATHNRDAKRLMDKPKISTRIEEIRAPIIEEVQYTYEGQLKKFQAAYDLAKTTDQPSAMTGAVDKQTKLLDLYPADKVKLDIDAADIVARIHKGRLRADDMS
jgi:phage terminase small subunit